MKRILIIMLCVVLCLGLAACSSGRILNAVEEAVGEMESAMESAVESASDVLSPSSDPVQPPELPEGHEAYTAGDMTLFYPEGSELEDLGSAANIYFMVEGSEDPVGFITVATSFFGSAATEDMVTQKDFQESYISGVELSMGAEIELLDEQNTELAGQSAYYAAMDINSGGLRYEAESYVMIYDGSSYSIMLVAAPGYTLGDIPQFAEALKTVYFS